MLLLEGEDDLRTPVEGAQRVAAQFPQAKLVVAPATGPLGARLGRVGLRRAGLRALLPRPAGVDPLPAAAPRLPALAAAARPRCARSRPRAGWAAPAGGAVTALALTLRDVGEDALTRFILDERDPDLARGGGLRAGRYRIDGRNRLHLDEVVFVPGVRVSGLVRRFGAGRQSGRLRLRGSGRRRAVAARPRL